MIDLNVLEEVSNLAKSKMSDKDGDISSYKTIIALVDIIKDDYRLFSYASKILDKFFLFNKNLRENYVEDPLLVGSYSLSETQYAITELYSNDFEELSDTYLKIVNKIG